MSTNPASSQGPSLGTFSGNFDATALPISHTDPSPLYLDSANVCLCDPKWCKDADERSNATFPHCCFLTDKSATVYRVKAYSNLQDYKCCSTQQQYITLKSYHKDDSTWWKINNTTFTDVVGEEVKFKHIKIKRRSEPGDLVEVRLHNGGESKNLLLKSKLSPGLQQGMEALGDLNDQIDAYEYFALGHLCTSTNKDPVKVSGSERGSWSKREIEEDVTVVTHIEILSLIKPENTPQVASQDSTY